LEFIEWAKMIIIDEFNYLEKELKSHGFEVFDFFDHCQVMDLKTFISLDLKRRSDFVLVDTQTLMNHPDQIENFKVILNTFLAVVFFHKHSNEKAQQWVGDESGFLTKIVGEYSLPMSQVSWTIFSNQLQFFWSLIEEQKKLQNHLVKFSSEIDELLKTAKTEVTKAKKLHDTLIPRRREDIKGITFQNRYAAGNGKAAEFYDFIQTPSKVYQILFSSQSYLTSSSLLAILAKSREGHFDPQLFIRSAYAEIESINAAKKTKIQTDLMVLELDLVSLRLSALTQSKVELYSQSSGKIDLALGDYYQLERGDKIIIFSSGFLFNWQEGKKGKSLNEALQKKFKDSSTELMSELFFQLKFSKDEQILQKDATLIVMEVHRHGVHKV